MIKNITLYAFKKALNHALSLDEYTLERLDDLSGKVVKLIIAPLNVEFFLLLGKEIDVLAEYPEEPDVIIVSKPLGLIRLSLLPPSKVRNLFNDEVQISGDVELGHKIKQIFDDLNLDWEGHLAQFTGDVVAHQIGSFVRKGVNFARGAKNSLTRNMTEYLQEELRLVPGAEELEDFFKDIDDLALEVERMSARIEHIKTKHEIH